MPLRISNTGTLLVKDGSNLVVGSYPNIVTDFYATVRGISEMTASKTGSGSDYSTSSSLEWIINNWDITTVNLTSFNRDYPFVLRQIKFFSIDPSVDFFPPRTDVSDIIVSSATTRAEKISLLRRYYWHAWDLIPISSNTVTQSYNLHYALPLSSNPTCHLFSYNENYDDDDVTQGSFWNSASFSFPHILANKIPQYNLPSTPCRPRTGGYSQSNYYTSSPQGNGIFLASNVGSWQTVIPCVQCGLVSGCTYNYEANPLVDAELDYGFSFGGRTFQENYILNETYTDYTVEQIPTVISSENL